MSQFLSQGVRTADSSSDVKVVSIVDMIQHIEAVDFRLVTDNAGIERLHLVAANENYFSIKLGENAVAKGDGVDRIKSIINSNIVYAGETENGVWFTFGQPAVRKNNAVTVKVASLFGSNQKALVG